MEYNEIKQIIKDMEKSKLSELEIEFKDGTKIKMKKEIINTISEKCNNSENIIQKEVYEDVDNKNEVYENIVTLPMVGMFYRKPSPDSKPYVQIGDVVKKGDVLCLIEAMKLMNEIESEFDGVITEVLVEDGKPVDFGKPLFKIK